MSDDKKKPSREEKYEATLKIGKIVAVGFNPKQKLVMENREHGVLNCWLEMVGQPDFISTDEAWAWVETVAEKGKWYDVIRVKGARKYDVEMVEKPRWEG